MISVTYVLVLLIATGSVAAANKGVIFKRLYVADPCEDKVLVLTADGGWDFEYRFRLNCTDVVFTARNTGTVKWEGVKPPLYTAPELLFLRQQGSVLAKTLSRFLGRITVRLYYEFNTETKDYIFYFFVNGQAVSLYRGGTTHYYDYLSTLDPQVSAVVKKYGSGINISLLKRHAQTMGRKWHDYCTKVKKLGTTEGNYSLTYDGSRGKAICSVQSKIPWYHLVFFNSTAANDVTRTYNAANETHLTVGSANFSVGVFTICNITFPDGTIALQNMTTNAIRAPSTTTIATTAALTIPPMKTPSVKAVPSVSDTFATSPTSEYNRTGGDELGETGESAASSAGTTAAAVLVVLALLVGGGVGLFVYRNRLIEVFSQFRMVPTEGR